MTKYENEPQKPNGFTTEQAYQEWLKRFRERNDKK